jgi:DNA-binding beta-propeller fold protein YncE
MTNRRIGGMQLGLLAALMALPFVWMTGCGNPDRPVGADLPGDLPPGTRLEKWRFRGELWALAINTVQRTLTVYKWDPGHNQWDQLPDDPFSKGDMAIMDLLDARQRTLEGRVGGGTAVFSKPGPAAAAPQPPPGLVYLLSTNGFLKQLDPANPASTKRVDQLQCSATTVTRYTNEFDVSPDGSVALVVSPNESQHCLIFVDLVNWKIASKLALPSDPATNNVTVGSVRFSPDGKLAYLPTYTNIRGQTSAASVYVIDVAKAAIQTVIPIPHPPLIDSIAISPDGLTAYLNCRVCGLPQIPVLDLTTNTVASYISTNQFIGFGMALRPDGSKLYLVPLLTYGPVTIVDTATNQVIRTIPSQAPATSGGPPSPQPGYPDPIFTPDGRFLFILNAPNAISVVDTITDQVVSRLPLAPPPSGPGIPLNPQQYVTMFFVPDSAPQ